MITTDDRRVGARRSRDGRGSAAWCGPGGALRGPTAAAGTASVPTSGNCGRRRGSGSGGGRRELWREAGERDRRRAAAGVVKGAGSTADRSRLSGGTVADGGGSAPYRGEGGAGQQVVQEAVRRNQVRAAGALLLPPCHDLAPSRRRPAGWRRRPRRAGPPPRDGPRTTPRSSACRRRRGRTRQPTHRRPTVRVSRPRVGAAFEQHLRQPLVAGGGGQAEQVVAGGAMGGAMGGGQVRKTVQLGQQPGHVVRLNGSERPRERLPGAGQRRQVRAQGGSAGEAVPAGHHGAGAGPG